MPRSVTPTLLASGRWRRAIRPRRGLLHPLALSAPHPARRPPAGHTQEPPPVACRVAARAHPAHPAHPARPARPARRADPAMAAPAARAAATCVLGSRAHPCRSCRRRSRRLVWLRSTSYAARSAKRCAIGSSTAPSHRRAYPTSHRGRALATSPGSECRSARAACAAHHLRGHRPGTATVKRGNNMPNVLSSAGRAYGNPGGSPPPRPPTTPPRRPGVVGISWRGSWPVRELSPRRSPGAAQPSGTAAAADSAGSTEPAPSPAATDPAGDAGRRLSEWRTGSRDTVSRSGPGPAAADPARAAGACRGSGAAPRSGSSSSARALRGPGPAGSLAQSLRAGARRAQAGDPPRPGQWQQPPGRGQEPAAQEAEEEGAI